MSFEQPPLTPSPSERGRIEKKRTLSDAELLQEGAEYTFNDEGEGQLQATNKQIEDIWKEMEHIRRENPDYVLRDELSFENINRSFKNKMPLPVKVKRTSGVIEDGWIAIAGYEAGDDISVLVAKQVEGSDTFLKKYIPLEDLKEVN